MIQAQCTMYDCTLSYKNTEIVIPVFATDDKEAIEMAEIVGSKIIANAGFSLLSQAHARTVEKELEETLVLQVTKVVLSNGY